MNNIDLKTIFIGIFVFTFIFFKISDRRAKHYYMKMENKGKWNKKEKHFKNKVGRYVPFNKEYVLDTSNGNIFKPEIR